MQQGEVNLSHNRFWVPIHFFLSSLNLRLVFKSVVTLDSFGNGMVAGGIDLCGLRIVRP